MAAASSLLANQTATEILRHCSPIRMQVREKHTTAQCNLPINICWRLGVSAAPKESQDAHIRHLRQETLSFEDPKTQHFAGRLACLMS